MINLLVDEAYYFDFLAILIIKEEYLGGQNLDEYIKNLRSQIGDKYFSVIYSKTFKTLLLVNKESFELIEKVRGGASFTAKYMDDLNTERFVLKKKLQKEFFDSEISEKKSNDAKLQIIFPPHT